MIARGLQRLVALLILTALGLCVYLIWDEEATLGGRIGQPAAVQSRILARELDALSRRELVRAWACPGQASRQATWNLVNARYLLDKTGALAPKKVTPQNTVVALSAALGRLLKAEMQSRLGQPAMIEESPVRLRAYFSDVDDTLQPYSVSIPPVYDPSVTWPLIVSLHGHGWWRPYQGHPAPRYAGAFCVSPHGRGATDYMDLGEGAVLRSVDEVCRDFSIDPDRVYITGGSMGGTGSFHLAVHHADRFAGIMPIAGNADFRSWTRRWGWNQPFPGRFDALREWLQDTHTARAYAENLLNLPSYIMHGAADTVVPPEHARFMVARLRACGCPVEYREFPGVGHSGFPSASVTEGFAWLQGHARNPYPRHVRWRTALLRRGRAYWIRIDRMQRPCSFAEIDATALDRSRVRVQTRNVHAFAVERNPVLFDPARPLFIEIDDDRVILAPTRDHSPTWIGLRLTEDRGWDLAAAPAEGAATLSKRAGLEGPIHEALLQPFVLVRGTQTKDPRRLDLWRREAWSFVQEWRRRNQGYCRLIRDTDCTAAIAATHNLILFGGSADNSVSAALMPRLPLLDIAALATERLPPSRTETRAAELLDAEDVGLFLVYPNPEYPERLVVLLHAGGEAAIYQAWKRSGNWFNWGVLDSKKYFDYAVYDAFTASPESHLLLGYFSTDWNLRSGVWHDSDPEVRAMCGAQTLPAWAQVPEGRSSFDLVELQPEFIDQTRGAVGFGRSYHGEPLQRSLGVRAPSVLEYRLDARCSRFTTRAELRNDPHMTLCSLREHGEKVRFVVKGDDRVLAAETVSWENPVLDLDVCVIGVRVLRLEVQTAGGPGWLHAGAAWLGPRLFR